VYRENTDKKDQGRAVLDEGSTPLVPDEDTPAVMQAATPVADEGGRSYKIPIK
jgi:hypothetical protein